MFGEIIPPAPHHIGDHKELAPRSLLPTFLVSVAAMGAATNARGTPRKRSVDEKILHLKKKGRPGGN